MADSAFSLSSVQTHSLSEASNTSSGKSGSSCPICYESFDDSHRETIAENQFVLFPQAPITLSCDHRFCHSCLHQHCQLFLEQHHKVPIRCPERICQAPLTFETVQAVLLVDEEKGATTLKKYERLIHHAEDPSLVPCPSCDALLHPEKAQPTDRSHSHELQCSDCQQRFCTKHGMACQKSESCLIYEQSLRFQASEQVLESHTRPCPHCGARIFKDAGCDHIVCPSCHEDFCWKCGSHEFLVGKLTRTCKKCSQSYLDHRYDRQHRLRTCLWLPFLIPFMLAYICIMFAICIATGFFCCCCGCTMTVEDMEQNDDKNNSSSLQKHSSRSSTKSTSRDGLDELIFKPMMTQSPTKAIRTGFNVIFLPVLLFVHQLGYHIEFVDQIMAHENPGHSKNGFMLDEIPTFDEDDDEENAAIAPMQL